MSDVIKIQDDLLTLEENKDLWDNLMRIPWSICSDILGKDLQCDELDNMQFQNLMYSSDAPRGNGFWIVSPILNKLPIASLCRVKVNFNPRRDRIIKHGFHIDFPFECTTAIYYVNSNDGCTTFEDGTVVESVANRLVTFPSTMKHTGSTCTNAKGRMVVNLNYFATDCSEWLEFIKDKR